MDTGRVTQLLKRSPQLLGAAALLIAIVTGCLLFGPPSIWNELGLPSPLSPFRFEYEMFISAAFLFSVSVLFALLVLRLAVGLWDWSTQKDRATLLQARRRRTLRGLSDVEKDVLRPYVLEDVARRRFDGEANAARLLEAQGILRRISSRDDSQPLYEIDPEAYAYLKARIWLLMPRGKR